MWPDPEDASDAARAAAVPDPGHAPDAHPAPLQYASR